MLLVVPEDITNNSVPNLLSNSRLFSFNKEATSTVLTLKDLVSEITKTALVILRAFSKESLSNLMFINRGLNPAFKMPQNTSIQ